VEAARLATKTDLLESALQPISLSVQSKGVSYSALINEDWTGAHMLENQKITAASVMGPLGQPLTLETLPPPSTSRWVPRRKAEVVFAVRGHLLSLEEACQLYSISLEEFRSWERAVERSGMPGLRVTRMQLYRALHDNGLPQTLAADHVRPVRL
jgi:hypothetical protein